RITEHLFLEGFIARTKKDTFVRPANATSQNLDLRLIRQDSGLPVFFVKRQTVLVEILFHETPHNQIWCFVHGCWIPHGINRHDYSSGTRGKVSSRIVNRPATLYIFGNFLKTQISPA